MLAGVCAITVLIVVANLACGPLIGLLAPKYLAAVPIFRIVVWAGLCPVLNVPAHALIAAKHTWAIAAGNSLCFAVFIAIAGTAVLLGLPSPAVAAAYLAGQLAGVLACWVVLWMKLHAAKTPLLAHAGTNGLALEDLHP